MTTARESPARAPEGARLRGSTRVLLMAFVVLTLVATNQLFVLARRTADLFSWTIQPPLSAAFLGASYAAGCVLSVLALRSRSWRDARVPLVTVLVFAVLTLLATLLHLDRFHFAAPGLVARAAAWIWLAVYVVVPVALLGVVLRQGRAAGQRPAPERRLPAWLRALLGIEGAVLVVVAVALLVVPGVSAPWWPWALTPLTARMTAAWLAALGVAALVSLRDDDLDAVRIPAVAFVVFALLQLLALALYGDALRTGSPSVVVYVVALVVSLATGVAGLVLSRSTTPRRTP
jgi:hypothetical protein